jgi:hypothetical protein
MSLTGWPCPRWVINGPRAASELGPLIPGQRTCSDYFSMSVSCAISGSNSVEQHFALWFETIR